jgi:DeoR/GlpR family transcriptional regulator of sugar metabolism
MSISSRQEQILKILNERVFITVNELAKLTFTSPSSIRRDLTFMQNGGLVVRTHGGVSLPQQLNTVANFRDRSLKNTKGKRILAEKAAALLKNGQSILLDGSTSAVFLLPHIAKFKSVTVFTNNLLTAEKSFELGIDTHIFGGKCVGDGSIALSGAETFHNIQNIKTDIFFFSAQSLDADGTISDTLENSILTRSLMLKSTKCAVFLCDNEKFNQRRTYKLANLSEIDYAVFDKPYDELKTTCKIL